VLSLGLLFGALSGCATTPSSPSSSLSSSPSSSAGKSPDATRDEARGSIPLLVNAGFEASSGLDGAPAPWEAVQHTGELSYVFAADRRIARSGVASLRIDGIGSQPYGAIWQVLPARELQGRTVTLTGWMRTRDASATGSDGGGALLLQPMRGSFVMSQDVPRGAAQSTTDWTRYEVRVVVPRDADLLRVGVTLLGRGTVWVDDLELQASGDGR
jgi:hypothetical protein